MTSEHQVSRRRFLTAGAAAADAVALPAMFSHCACSGPELEPVPDNELEKISGAAPSEPTVKAQKTRRLLVFYRCERFVHGAINRGNAALELIGEKTGTWQVTVSKDMSVFDPSSLNQYDGVVFNNTSRLAFEDPRHCKALMDFGKGGKGVCGIHAATDNSYNWPEAAEMMGGLFDGHPWGGGGTWAVQIEEPDHPLNRAFEGRGFYSSLGHNNDIFWTPAFLRHFMDGVQYALGDLAADATPSAALASRPAIVPDPPRP